MGTAAGGQPAAASREDDVKAVFLYNFAKYIEWPKTAFTAATDPFHICVVGDDAFSRTVARTIEGEVVDGRAFVAVAPATDEAARSCHLLFIGRLEAPRIDRLLAATAEAPVLTVGDSAALLGRGGVIALVVEDNRVRFDVNVAAARGHGLTISSKLLRVARKVVEPAPVKR